MSSFIKKVASAPTRSLKNEYGIPLDLAYITERILVCSCPVSKFPQTLYRNSLNDLLNYMEIKHGDNWSIWNFKTENLDDYSWNHKSLKNKLFHFPWPDHQAPPFQLLLDSVNSIHRFLEKDPQNVAILHCKMGKGRSGLICISYLMIHGGFAKDHSCQLFTSKRMNPGFGEGVSILSQLRYLNYCSLHIDHLYQPYSFPQINHIRIMGGDPNSPSVISLSTYVGDDYTYHSLDPLTEIDISLQNNDCCIYKLNELVHGQDIRISIEPSSSSPFTASVFTWFNTYWEAIDLHRSDLRCQERGIFKCSWDEMDGFKGTQFKGKKLFEFLEIYFTFA